MKNYFNLNRSNRPVLLARGAEPAADNTSEKVIYEDDTLKATYKGISENAGVVVMTVKLENKTDSEITVLPMDFSVDGNMVQFTSGIPATIQGGKSFSQGWIIGSLPTEQIQFSMSVYDENMSEILKTDILTVKMDYNRRDDFELFFRTRDDRGVTYKYYPVTDLLYGVSDSAEGAVSPSNTLIFKTDGGEKKTGSPAESNTSEKY